jgi:hypothetical protein
MNSRFLSRLVATAALAASLMCALPLSSKEPNGAPRLRGTFLQLNNENGSWPIEKWEGLFGNFRALGLNQLVLQWTVSDQVAFYPSGSGPVGTAPPLQTIIELADKAGIDVYVGLIFEPDFWKLNGLSTADADTYFQQLLARSAKTANELKPLVAHHSSFKGWYVVQEVEYTSWSAPDRQALLFTYLRNLSAFLHATTPKALIAISGFSNGTESAESLSKFWNALLHEAPSITAVFFQDGIGVSHLTTENLVQYLTAMKQVVTANGRNYETIIEIFRQTGSTTAGESGAVPAPVAEVLNQLKTAASVSSGTLAFSVPDYMTPLAGPAADKLYRDYLDAVGDKSASALCDTK